MIKPNRIAHVVLKVRDLERSKRFYMQILGLDLMGEIQQPKVAFLAANRNDHHEIGLLEVGMNAPAPDPRAVGLVHVAFRLESREKLEAAYEELRANDVPISFTVDHGVTDSVYFTDPDGNELEVYCDNSAEHIAAMKNAYSGMQGLDFAKDSPSMLDYVTKLSAQA